jgi:hypothetical protein
MPTGITMGGSIAANQRFWCCVNGCDGRRFKLQPYCIKHHERNRNTGDPNGSTPDPRQWAWERKAVTDLFETNPDHPGLTRALAYLDTWTQRATSADHQGNHWAQEVARVVRHGVSSKAILVELCAAWSYLERCKRAVPSDRALKFSLSHAVLKLAPRPVRVTAWRATRPSKERRLKAHWRALEEVGGHLQGVFVSLLVHVHQAIHAQEEAARAAVLDFRAPFRPTPTAISTATQQLPVTSE